MCSSSTDVPFVLPVRAPIDLARLAEAALGHLLGAAGGSLDRWCAAMGDRRAVILVRYGVLPRSGKAKVMSRGPPTVGAAYTVRGLLDERLDGNRTPRSVGRVRFVQCCMAVSGASSFPERAVLSADTSAAVERLQVDAWCRMSPLDKARTVDALTRTAQALALAGS